MRERTTKRLAQTYFRCCAVGMRTTDVQREALQAGQFQSQKVEEFRAPLADVQSKGLEPVVRITMGNGSNQGLDFVKIEIPIFDAESGESAGRTSHVHDEGVETGAEGRRVHL